MSPDTTTLARISRLDHAVDAGGIDTDRVALLLLAHTAQDLGVNDILVSTMIDEAEPEPARVRAYARVAVAVAGRLSSVPAGEPVRELQPAC